LDLDKIRSILLSKKKNITSRLHTKEELSSRPQNPDNSDLALRFVQKERSSLLDSEDESKLREIEAALRRISDGTYGQCDHCGRGIHPIRLETLPTVTNCIDCQREEEA
jgi:RNA polymerase-binding protein DksA